VQQALKAYFTPPGRPLRASAGALRRIQADTPCRRGLAGAARL